MNMGIRGGGGINKFLKGFLFLKGVNSYKKFVVCFFRVSESLKYFW